MLNYLSLLYVTQSQDVCKETNLFCYLDIPFVTSWEIATAKAAAAALCEDGDGQSQVLRGRHFLSAAEVKAR